MSTSAALKAHAHTNRRRTMAAVCLFSLLCVATYVLSPALPSVRSLVYEASWTPPFRKCGITAASSNPDRSSGTTSEGGEWNFWETQAQYAPFLTSRNVSEEVLPDGCEIDQVTILHRHTARYPCLSALQDHYDLLDKIAGSPLLANESFYSAHPEFRFLKYAVGEDGRLSPERVLGDWKADELTDLGQRSYKHLVDNADLDRPLFTRSSDISRVVETAGYWLMGYRGGDFRKYSKDTETIGNTGPEQVDVVMPSGRSQNSTLKVRTCRNWEIERRKPAYTGPPSMAAYLPMAAALPMEYMSNRLNLPDRQRLRVEDFMPLMSLCAYSASAKPLGQVTDVGGVEAWYRSAEADRGGWCGIFAGLGRERERGVWEAYAYAHDINKHYARSTGGPYGASMGVGYVNELLARLQDRMPVDETTTNRDLDEDEQTFPRGGKRMFVDFGHDNEMLEVLAALNVMTDANLPTSHPPSPQRAFMQQRLTPFGGVLAFERIICPAKTGSPSSQPSSPQTKLELGKDAYVRIFVNNVRAMAKDDACKSSPLSEFGMCELGAFVESQAFSREGGDWARRCFEEVN